MITLWLAFTLVLEEPVLSKLTLQVEGKPRDAWVVPAAVATPESSPLVFAFHGHGGSGRNSAAKFAIHKLWPEAVVVYPNGLPTPTARDPEGKRPGWQNNPGEMGDRDLKFFDVLLERLLQDHRIDPRRIYVMGHSNGSRFSCVLWAKRGDKFAAACTSGGQGGRLLQDAARLPVFMIAGEKDSVVDFQGQKRQIDALAAAYGVDKESAKTRGYFRFGTGKDGVEVVTYLHPGGHEWPEAVREELVRFFKRQQRPSAGKPVPR